MNATEFQLITEYLDGSLDGSGVAELNQRLRAEPALIQEMAELMIYELHLRELGQLERLRAAERWTNPAYWMALLRSWRGRWPQWTPRPRWAIASAGLIAVLAVGLGWFLTGPMAPGRLATITGRVLLQRGAKQWRAVAGTALRPGDRMVLDPGAVAEVAFRNESTWLRFTDSAQAQFDRFTPGKTITVTSGSVAAQVAPQRAPLRLQTPVAEAAVLGTEFDLVASADRTRLEVWQGEVRLTRQADGQSAGVRAGSYAVATRTGPFTAIPAAHGVWREIWAVGREPSATELSQSSCLRRPPTGTMLLPRFEAPSNSGDGFVARVRGSLRPPVTGLYQFWVAGDDAAELWLSPNERPEDAVKICATDRWTGPFAWEESPNQQSRRIRLEAGRAYAIEALQREEAGGDHLAVAWQIPGGTRTVIPGEALVPPRQEDGSLRPRDTAAETAGPRRTGGEP